MKTIHLISLGCAKNLVDSERFLASATGNFSLIPTDNPEKADIILINTCAFLQSAVEEALDFIMKAGAAKKKGARLMAAGCLPARYLTGEADIREKLPEVDIWLTPGDYHNFEIYLANYLKAENTREAAPAFGEKSAPKGPRRKGAPFCRAFLKISEGCDKRCSYCLIPRLRGPLVSYDADFLALEAESLAACGVKELTLVAQDLTAYGRDRGEKKALLRLVKRLSNIPGLNWIRLLYAYPEGLSEALVKGLAAIPNVVPYLDIPFQHVSPQILKSMGRGGTNPMATVEKLRRWWPDITLRSTLIVGFPGETDTHFAEMENFVDEAMLEHLGVFKFSPEEGAPAAGYPLQVPRGIKEKRRRRLMSLQREVSRINNMAWVGESVPVLVEGLSPESDLVMVGRAPFQAPEVDGVIYFKGEQPKIGEMVQTRIIKAGDYDLIGVVEQF